MNKLQVIDFNQIYSALLKLYPGIKISYLTAEELDMVANFPIKEEHSLEISSQELLNLIENKGICLVIIQGEKFNTTTHIKHIKDLVMDILNQLPEVEYTHLYYLNRKFAAMMSGLGQYGKNQLIYNSEFGFHHTIWTFAIHNTVINLPKRYAPKFGYMDMCEGCNECIKNCPAHALHGDLYPGWLDKFKCQEFFQFGDHPIIPSAKYGINAFLGHPYTDEELKQAIDQNSFKKLFGFVNTEGIVHKDDKTYRITMHYCKECRNQLPCRKREQHYDRNYYEVAEERPFDPNAIV